MSVFTYANAGDIAQWLFTLFATFMAAGLMIEPSVQALKPAYYQAVDGLVRTLALFRIPEQILNDIRSISVPIAIFVAAYFFARDGGNIVFDSFPGRVTISDGFQYVGSALFYLASALIFHGGRGWFADRKAANALKIAALAKQVSG